MMSDSRPAFQTSFEWRITLFTVLMVPVMLALGFWQLQRAQEKADLAALFAQRERQIPAEITALWDKPPAQLAYLPVQMSGVFLAKEFFLLDNRVLGGRFGYEVLGTLRLDNGDSVLINRGWIAADTARLTLPEVPQINARVQISGHVYVAPGKPFLLAEQQLDTAWPKRIQAAEMQKLIPPVEALQGGRVFPYPVRINAGEPGALTVDWQIVNVSPEKHQAYAVQWFAMSATLLLFFVLRSSNLWQWLKSIGRSRN